MKAEGAAIKSVLSAECSVRRELQVKGTRKKVKGKRKKVKGKSDGEFLVLSFPLSTLTFQLLRPRH
jgi:hypothetical protein